MKWYVVSRNKRRLISSLDAFDFRSCASLKDGELVSDK